MSMKPEDVVATFDSASVMHSSTVAALQRKAFPHLGNPDIVADLARVGTRMPWPILKNIYARIGGAEGIDPKKLGEVDMGDVAASFATAYPARQYPAVFIGSSNGALTHLAAAMQAPWLPNTVLIPVKRVADADRPDLALEFGREHGPALLDANPQAVLHQMHDSAQDALMVARMTYFRTKWNTLPSAYADFLSHRLADDAPILLVDDQSRWPVTRVSERHVFQNGGRGGLAPEEYLAMPHSPAADDEAPEAEWGAEPGFVDAVLAWGLRNGHPVHRIVVDGPQEAAHPVAVTMRRWTRERGGAADRLLIPSFILGDPWRTIELGDVPFWTFFPVQSALSSLVWHLAHSDPYVDADITLFQHGAESKGIATPQEFADAIAKSGARPHFLGLREEASPHDLGAMARYGPALQEQTPAGIPFEALTPEAAVASLGQIAGERGRPILPRPVAS